MSNYKYLTPQLLLKAICNAIRAKTGSNNKIIHQNIPDELDNIITEEEYYEEQIENISSIYTGTNLNFSINNNDIITIPKYKFDYSNLTTINLPKCISIETEAIANCSNLTTVNLPICTSIGYRAIANCPNLTTVNLPKCTSIGDSAFSSCTSLTTISFPECASIGGNAFIYCSNLTTVNLPKCTSIGSGAFNGCNLTTLILNSNQVVVLDSIYTITFISNGTGYAYVPDNLVNSYKTATNWSSYANQIKPLSELPSNLKEEYGYE